MYLSTAVKATFTSVFSLLPQKCVNKKLRDILQKKYKIKRKKKKT